MGAVPDRDSVQTRIKPDTLYLLNYLSSYGMKNFTSLFLSIHSALWTTLMDVRTVLVLFPIKSVKRRRRFLLLIAGDLPLFVLRKV